MRDDMTSIPWRRTAGEGGGLFGAGCWEKWGVGPRGAQGGPDDKTQGRTGEEGVG